MKKIGWSQILRDKEGTVYKDWTQDGIRCQIVRGTAALCAYLGVPIDHPFAGRDYDDVSLECHGGLTYSRKGCNAGRPVGWWWYGWDYGHAGDAVVFSNRIHGHEWLPVEVKKEIDNFVFHDFQQLAKKAKPIKTMDNNISNELKEYLGHQKTWVKNGSVTKNSRVTVMDKAPQSAFMPDIWAPFMDDLVGKEGKVIYPDDVNGVFVEFEDGVTAAFPFFVLSVND